MLLPFAPDALAVNHDIGLERIRQSHELVSDSQMESEDVANPDLATGDVDSSEPQELPPFNRIPAAPACQPLEKSLRRN